MRAEQGGIRAAECDPDARPAIEGFLTLFGTDRPSLRQIWAAMDFVWDSLGADNLAPDEGRLEAFYRHPVWLLNGMFIEQHEESLAHRRAFAGWVASTRAARVADFGGGHGTLARMIAERCPEAAVEVIEPYPRPESLRASRRHANLSFAEALAGQYDVIVATDVFEHVPDPVGLLFEVGSHVRRGGRLMTANHFAPSIKCHLPGTFHLGETWDLFAALAGFERVGSVRYGQVYVKRREAELSLRVRRLERLSARSHALARRVRGVARLRRVGARALTGMLAHRV